MSNQLFLATYFDTDHQRITFYSGAPLNLQAVQTLAEAYRVVEAQFLPQPIVLLYDENHVWEGFGIPTWSDSVRVVAPDDLQHLDLDPTAMICVNRAFLRSLSTEDKDVDILDVMGSISVDLIQDVFAQKSCFICIVREDKGLPPVPEHTEVAEIDTSILEE